MSARSDIDSRRRKPQSASGAAERQRQRRRRQRQGKMVLRVEVDEVDVPEALIILGYLRRDEGEDHARVSAALEKALSRWLAVASKTVTP